MALFMMYRTIVPREKASHGASHEPPRFYLMAVNILDLNVYTLWNTPWYTLPLGYTMANT